MFIKRVGYVGLNHPQFSPSKYFASKTDFFLQIQLQHKGNYNKRLSNITKKWAYLPISKQLHGKQKVLDVYSSI